MSSRFRSPSPLYHHLGDSLTASRDLVSSGLHAEDLEDAPVAALEVDVGGSFHPKHRRRRASWWGSWSSLGRLWRSGSNKKREYNVADVEIVEEKPAWRPVSSRIRAAAKLGLRLVVFILAFLGIIHLFDIFVSPWYDDDQPSQFLPHWGQPNYLGAGLQSYPTDFTRDVIPLPCHSHNDYWRRVPLYEAIHYGCTGVEADVWSVPNDEELYVGHRKASLTHNRTFRSLYIDPLVQILEHQNPSIPLSNVTRNGVFDEQPDRTLVLLVDFKTNGSDLWLQVVSQLEPLRSRNYLTYFNGTSVVPGPITVVGTGNCPFDILTANTTYRDIFFDAPFDELWDSPISAQPAPPRPKHNRQDTGQGRTGLPSQTPDVSLFTPQTSYYASVSFARAIGRPWFGRLSASQIEKIRRHIKGAQAQGLKARFWDTPAWPIGLRDYVWDTLVSEGVDVLNVDDLRGATRMAWGKGWWASR